LPLGILLFDPRREHSSVPTAESDSRRAQGLSRLAALRGHPKGLALTGPSTAAPCIGRDRKATAAQPEGFSFQIENNVQYQHISGMHSPNAEYQRWVNFMSTQIVSDARRVLARANTNLFIRIYAALCATNTLSPSRPRCVPPSRQHDRHRENSIPLSPNTSPTPDLSSHLQFRHPMSTSAFTSPNSLGQFM
jgi:hypothetical protein